MSEICIMCTAFNRNGSAMLSREYNINQPLTTTVDYCLSHFIGEIDAIANVTVRIVVDIALPKGWHNVSQ